MPNNAVAPPAEILLLSACCFSCFSSASSRSFFISPVLAKSLGVFPELFFNKGFAPFAMRIFTTSVWPSPAAQCKGVIPFASPASIFALTFAPFAMRIFTTSVWPSPAAQCKGVIPFSSPTSIFALTFAPFSIRRFTIFA
nr:hypothetical protein [Wolbachia endosymbiont of Oedothorax gibbosus]